MKREGFNILEMIIIVAIVGIVFSLTAPLIKSFGMVNERIRVQNEVDREFAMVSKFIKEQVRSARRTSETLDVDVKYAAIFDGDDFDSFSDLTLETELDEDTGKISAISTGPILFLEIPYEDSEDDSDDVSKLVFFVFDDNQLKYIEDFDDSTEEILMENVDVSNSSFELSTEGAVTFSIDLDVGDYEGKIKDSIRESAVSRIDLDI